MSEIRFIILVGIHIDCIFTMTTSLSQTYFSGTLIISLRVLVVILVPECASWNVVTATSKPWLEEDLQGEMSRFCAKFLSLLYQTAIRSHQANDQLLCDCVLTRGRLVPEGHSRLGWHNPAVHILLNRGSSGHCADL